MLLGESVAAVGLECLSFADGGAALAAALENDVAIVLLDVDMPGSTATKSAAACAPSRASAPCRS